MPTKSERHELKSWLGKSISGVERKDDGIEIFLSNGKTIFFYIFGASLEGGGTLEFETNPKPKRKI